MYKNIKCRARAFFFLCLVSVVVALPTAAETLANQHLAGRWQGTLAVGEHQLRIVFDVKTTESGLEATMDSPDQGATGIPIAAVEAKADSVRFEVRVINAEYQGSLSSDHQAIDGEWQQAGQALPLKLERISESPVDD